MSTNIFARRRSWLGVLALLALFATLLPPRTWADDTYSLSREQTNIMFMKWYAAKLPKKRGNLLVETAIVGNIILHINLPPAIMKDQLNALNARYYKLLGPRGADPAYRKSLPLMTLSKAMYDAGIQTPAFRDATLQAHRRLKIHESDLNATSWDGIPPKERAVYKTIAKDTALRQAYSTLLDEQLEGAAKRAPTDKELVEIFDATIGPTLGIRGCLKITHGRARVSCESILRMEAM